MKKMLLLAAPVLLLFASSFTPVPKNPRTLRDTKDVLFNDVSGTRFVPISIDEQFRSKDYGTEIKYSPRFRYRVTTAVDDRNIRGKLLLVINKTDNKLVYLGMTANLHNIPASVVFKSMAKNGGAAKETQADNDCMCDCRATGGEAITCYLHCYVFPEP